MSTFLPTWLDGEPQIADFATTPGDGIDGYARVVVVAPVHAFTHAPKGYTHAEAATLTTAGLTAWRARVVDSGLKAGASVLVLGTGGVSIFALQLAKANGGVGDRDLVIRRQAGACALGAAQSIQTGRVGGHLPA